MTMHAANRHLAILTLARRALEGLSPDALEEAAVNALGVLDGPEIARSIAGELASARDGGALDHHTDPDVREALALVRAAVRRCAASQSLAERYRLMLERASDGVYIIDANGRYVDVNASGAEMLGYTKEELYRLHIYELVDPNDPPIDFPAVRAGHSIIRHRNIRRKDGSFMLAELSSHMLPDGTIFGIARDITDRVRAHRELRESAERFRQALRAARAGAWEWIASTNHAFWSEETFALMGMAPSEIPITYEDWLARTHPDDRALVHAASVRAGRERSDFDAEYRVVLSDGAIRWMHTVGNMVVGEDGAPARMYGIHVDITERKRAELARTEAEEKLHQAQRMEAIGRLAGGIAHDFNNLLTVILAAVEVVADELPPEGLLGEHLEAVRQAGTRGAALTRQLLALSRHQPPDAKALDLDVQLRRMAPILRRLLGEDIEIRVETLASAPHVRIDPTQLDQVFLNLAINARDAMPRGGVLRFSTALEDDGRTVVLSVTDDGLGMDDETRARVFEPFFTTKPAGSGTGLGLATVYGIVRHAGGAVDVESTPGRGTTFRIRLPATDAVRESAPPADRPSASRGSMLVLVVEDEPSVRRILRRILESEGHRVIEASDGAQAVALVERAEERIDVVLSDVVMPTMSGPELTARLRANQPDLPVLLMSGYLGDALARHGVAPDVALLEKPFTPEMLLSALGRAVDQSPRSEVTSSS